MTAYVALLRGINVGGHSKVPMADLRAVVAELGHEDIATYVQSGNVLFSSDGEADEAAVRAALEDAIAAHFGFAVDVAVRSREALTSVAELHPLDGAGREPSRLHVFFLVGEPDLERVAALRPDAFAPDELLVAGREVYVYYANGAGRSKLKIDLGTPATARNWRTVLALRERLEAMP